MYWAHRIPSSIRRMHELGTRSPVPDGLSSHQIVLLPYGLNYLVKDSRQVCLSQTGSKNLTGEILIPMDKRLYGDGEWKNCQVWSIVSTVFVINHDSDSLRSAFRFVQKTIIYKIFAIPPGSCVFCAASTVYRSKKIKNSLRKLIFEASITSPFLFPNPSIEKLVTDDKRQTDMLYKGKYLEKHLSKNWLAPLKLKKRDEN